MINGMGGGWFNDVKGVLGPFGDQVGLPGLTDTFVRASELGTSRSRDAPTRKVPAVTGGSPQTLPS